MRPPGRWLRHGALVLVLLLAVPACGGSDESRYGEEVDAIQAAVEAGDRTGAIDALQALQIDITEARRTGDLEQERFDELQALIYESRTLIDSLLPPPSTAPPPPPSTDAPDDEEDEEEDEDDGEGNGRGNGNGRGRGRG